MSNKSIALLLVLFMHFNIVYSQPEFLFEHFNSSNTTAMSSGNNFKSIGVTTTGKIWAGSQYQGIFRYSPPTNVWEKCTDLTNISVNDIQLGQYDDIWIGQSGTSGTASIAGGINRYANNSSITSANFYSITGTGGLTSRNVRSVWIDKNHRGQDNKYKVWAAQGTFSNSGTSTAGGISVGLNTSGNSFTKIYKGLQVTPNVPSGQAGLPNCISIGGYSDEVWVCALANFGRSQILRYRADDPGIFIGYYDYTNTPQLSIGFRANAIFFDLQGRGWLGLSDGGLVIKTTEGWAIMNDASILPPGTIINPNAITQDESGYIYFGTSSGLLMYKGGPVESASSYRLLTTADGLPVNAINDVEADTINHRLILAHSSGISFMKFFKKIDYSLEWDYSFPKESIKPVGIAADGTSRLYMKIRRGTNVSMPIKKIGVSLKNIATQAASLSGKVKKALEISQYSNEANTGTAAQAERTDSTANGDFYFWYVAPDDFSLDSSSSIASSNERNDTIKIKVIYADDSEDSTYMPIKVVRPPVVMTSMSTAAKKVLESVRVASESVTLVLSNRFVSNTVIAMNQQASLADNASKLIDGDMAQNNDSKGSFQGILQAVREQGIAATRVDVIANDVSGVAVRVAQAIKPMKFFADGSHTFNNYGKGFINKFISINVPHNGSGLFQMIKDFGPKLSEISKKAVASLVKADDDDEPYEILDTENDELKINGGFLSKALMELDNFQIPETIVKNHLIATELTSVQGAIAEGVGAIGVSLKKYLDHLTLGIRDFSPELKPQIGALLGSEISSEARLLGTINHYSNLKGIQNFATTGDFFSNISSQLAGLPINSSNVSKVVYDVSTGFAGHMKTIAASAKKIVNLLNTSVHSPSFAPSIPAKNAATAVANVAQKIGSFFYDTAKIVVTNREDISNLNYRFTNEGIRTEAENDTSITLHYRVKDTSRLQYVFINFQDTLYTSTSKLSNQQVELHIKRSMILSGRQELTAVAVYENQDSIRYHADTLNSWISMPDTLKGFRVIETEADLFNGIPYQPAYEVKINEEWQSLPSNNPDISFVIENPSKATYNSSTYKFNAASDGFTRVYFTYKTYKDTVALNCLLSLDLIAINRTIVNGSFKDSATWSKGRPPLPADSIIISSGHSIILDTTIQVRSLKIETGASLTFNNNALQLTLGDAEDGDFMIDNSGTLIISNGSLKISGRVKMNTGSSFTMSGGMLIIDGNTGNTLNSLSNGTFMFEVLPGMASFNFSGGTLQLVDPPIGVASQALYCPYNFGPNSTLLLGNGISVTASNNPNGFGGSGFPPQIGKLILDASMQGNNRVLKITKPLSVKGLFEIRNGSNLNIQAPITVIP